MDKIQSDKFLKCKKTAIKETRRYLYILQKPTDIQSSNDKWRSVGIRKDQFTGSYGDFKPRHVKSNGERYPNDVVNFEEQMIDDFVYIKTAESEGKVQHPTQKPIELGRYLIKTYTNEGDIVLDNTCGVGSFLLSAILENRNFIGIEKNEDVLLHKVKKTDYIKICNERINETVKVKEVAKSTLNLFSELSPNS